MKTDKPLEISLFLIRISVAAFFLVWAIGKIIAPGITQAVAESYYSSPVTGSVSAVMGILQLVIVLTFLAGLLKTWTYGLLLGMHSVSVLVSLKNLVNPYTAPNYLFWAAIPTLAALIALFLLRERDQLFVLGRRHLSQEDAASRQTL
ncbi:hypothetical protein N836_29505 [Leptolyngbya sp. Heron Island J]|uniref:hypothetical protein n=1 Tax=Leptolyngbya sp. Heron Island J TaxID=1385935 RepID=UPI0003B9AF4B|nr:hypothetical protein [Leptolyngbya sp. Heron Island J]ESA38933.1 hypothetical protein N836_29505 [Leptolyngbya sp. Heron Island J]